MIQELFSMKPFFFVRDQSLSAESNKMDVAKGKRIIAVRLHSH